MKISKQCIECDAEFLATAQVRICSDDCRRQRLSRRARERYAQTPGKEVEHVTKTCLQCGLEFQVEPHAKSRLRCSDECVASYRREYNKRYREEHREQIADAQRVWREENKDRVDANYRRYRAANADKIKARQRQYYIDNAEVIKAKAIKYGRENWHWLKDKKREHISKNREQYLEYWRRYYHSEKGQIAAKAKYERQYAEDKEGYYRRSAERRARKANARKGTPWNRQKVLDTYGTNCHLCQKPIDLGAHYRNRWSLHVDHLYPLSSDDPRDGLEWVRPSHASCNSTRHTRSVEDLELLPGPTSEDIAGFVQAPECHTT